MDFTNSLGGEDPKCERAERKTFLLTPRRQDAKACSCSHDVPKSAIRADVIAGKIVNAAFQVHKHFGPGLLESIYEKCLLIELEDCGCKVERQIPIDIIYRGITIEAGYRLDMCVDNLVIVENKTVERLEPIHGAQLATYLKLSGCTLGLLINWNVSVLRHGVRRVVFNHPERMS